MPMQESVPSACQALPNPGECLARGTDAQPRTGGYTGVIEEVAAVECDQVVHLSVHGGHHDGHI